MYELKITVARVLGTCTADPPMQVGDYFTVRDGNITIPEGGYVCLWALQSILPLITPKEREIIEDKDEDWMWRVHHAQCPDPQGRVMFKIERVGKVARDASESPAGRPTGPPDPAAEGTGGEGSLRNLRVVVEAVRGKCTSGMRPGDTFSLRSGRLYIPAQRHFCLYALHAVLPLLPAKQRALADDDWLKDDAHVICPDPTGNVIMRIEECQ
ncbi:MAG: TIGR04076 family protein [Chloroflexi bacterium]|nr:TIGR04076 family protein [Chloroflexota bacterium]MBU1750061.1 TIGR04076 family protein [Chloroflexota bacterium]